MTAYSVVRIDVKNTEEYAKYAEIATRAIKEFGGEFLARGGEYHHLEGTSRGRNVIINGQMWRLLRSFITRTFIKKLLVTVFPPLQEIT